VRLVGYLWIVRGFLIALVLPPKSVMLFYFDFRIVFDANTSFTRKVKKLREDFLNIGEEHGDLFFFWYVLAIQILVLVFGRVMRSVHVGNMRRGRSNNRKFSKKKLKVSY
jgi:hypothetical protein